MLTRHKKYMFSKHMERQEAGAQALHTKPYIPYTKTR
jgi:hypothetical protein